MGLLGNLLLAPIVGPLRGARYIIDRIQEQVEAELPSEASVRSKLFDLTMRYDRGAIGPEEYTTSQTALLNELNDVRALRRSLAGFDDGA